MNVNIALSNFEIAYKELIGAIESNSPQGADVTLSCYEVTSDIGTFNYLAKNKTHAINQFRAEHGYNRSFINQVRELKTNVDNGLHR